MTSLVDLGSYQGTLEEVLAWLLEAEEKLTQMSDVAQDVETVKDQFHIHEVNSSSILHHEMSHMFL